MFWCHMNNINHFVRVDVVWSYNLIRNLEGIVPMDMHVLDNIYRTTAAYLMAKHAFHMSGDNIQYNGIMSAIQMDLEKYECGSRYFLGCYDALFRMISPALAQMVTPILGVTTITTDTGDIEGFVFAT